MTHELPKRLDNELLLDLSVNASDKIWQTFICVNEYLDKDLHVSVNQCVSVHTHKGELNSKSAYKN